MYYSLPPLSSKKMKKIVPVFFIAISALISTPFPGFGQAPNLGTASSFAVFTANGALTNVGASVVIGDIGTNIGAFTGFPPGTVVGQTRLPGTTQADQAATDVIAAYNALTTAPCSGTIGHLLGNGQTLVPGVYCQNLPSAASTLNNVLVLDGAGTYIIKLNGALTTATGSSISLINGASLENVFFQVNGAVDVGVSAFFRGTILANGAIRLLDAASLEGRALSIAGAISLSNNRVTTISPALSLSVTAGACQTATNTYILTGTVTLTAAVASSLTILDGANSAVVSVSAGQTTANFSLSALVSGAVNHSVTVNGPGYSTVSTSYQAPASCTVTPDPASLGGVIFKDSNQDGVQNGGDTPLPGIVVTLLNSANSPIGSLTTNASGIYSFSGLTPGVPYSVSYSTPAGYSITTPAVNGVRGPVTLSAGEANTGFGAGFTPLTAITATLGGVIFTDSNQDGVQNGGDTPLPGIVVTLLNSASSPIGSLTTNASGIYSFSGLTPGVPYSVSYSTPAGYSITTPAVNGVRGPVTLSAGEINNGFGVGYYQLTPGLSLAKFVDNANAQKGAILRYTIVVVNSGSGPATNIVVRDSATVGLVYIPNSVTLPIGTTFTPGSPVSSWSIAMISAGQSLSLSFQARADSSGILYNSASIPGQAASVCTSIPTRVCANEPYAFVLTVPTGRSSYRWFKDNVELIGQNTNTLSVTAIGSYRLAVDNVAGLCPDFSCCPFILEEDTLPSFQVRAVPATCVGNQIQANGQLILSDYDPSHTVQYSIGNTFNPLLAPGPAQPIAAGGVLVTNLVDSGVAQAYTIRVYNRAGCFQDRTVILTPTTCSCPPPICVPVVIRHIK